MGSYSDVAIPVHFPMWKRPYFYTKALGMSRGIIGVNYHLCPLLRALYAAMVVQRDIGCYTNQTRYAENGIFPHSEL